ncbi:MAG: TonB-dependent receptor [Acidobacteria bacterium]|nr:TonB-dependent receptor [Acidobacteriota bacterium]
MITHKRFWFWLAVFVTVLAGVAGSGPTYGQGRTTATISGTVKDETGAVLPGVTVVAENSDTGYSLTTITSDAGNYTVPNLPLGNYRVRAELEGFNTVVHTGIKLTVGREAVVDFALKVGEISEQVTVTGEAPLVETRQATLADLVDDRQIRDLPLSGRSFTDLAFLQAGVMTRNRIRANYSSTGGGGAQLSIAGARVMLTSFLLDGTNIKDMLGVTPGSAAGTMLGVETVREFSVLATNYSAEFGGAGGVVNSVSKSGTNELHGTVFEFLRNDNMDARNFFDKIKPEFKRNQFGFVLGGPIIRDRTFFFGSYEGLRDRLGDTIIAQVPSAEARQGILTTGRVTVNPAIVPYLNLYPLPNTSARPGADVREFLRSETIPTNENYFMVRIDHKLSDADSMFVRYTFDKGERIGSQALPPFQLAARTRTQYVTIEENKVISPTFFNTFRFGFNRSRGGTPNLDPKLDRSLNFFQPESLYPDRFFGTVSVGGLSTLGGADTQDRAQVMNLFQYTDTIRLSRGLHDVSFGADVQRSQVNAAIGSRLHGTFSFANLRDFLRASPRDFQGLFPGTGTMRGVRQLQYGFFIQDDWRVTPRLTANVGVRWEFVTVPTEVAGRLSNIPNASDPAPTIGDPLFDVSKKNFGPRVGLAWDPWGNGKMAIRTGFGIFHQQQDYTNNFTLYFQNPPFFNRFTMQGAPFPRPFQSLADIPLAASGAVPIQFEVPTPYVMQYNVSIQRQLWADTQVTVSYVGTRGVHITRLMPGNINRFIIQPDGRKFFPVGTTRMNPNFENLDYKQSDTSSSYNSLQIRWAKRFSQGHQYQFSYTFSKSLDESSGLQGGSSGSQGVASMDPFDRSRDKGLSAWDVRHNFTANFGYALPGAGLQGIAGAVLGRWNLNSIVSLATGNPFTVRIGQRADRSRSNSWIIGEAPLLRPDLAPGGDNNPVLGGPDRYLDASQFPLQEAGFWGNLGRNTTIGPGYANVDFSVTKDFPIRESVRLQFRSEFFNIFNRANFAEPIVQIYNDATGVPASNFGRITSTVGTSRQVQFALKLTF